MHIHPSGLDLSNHLARALCRARCHQLSIAEAVESCELGPKQIGLTSDFFEPDFVDSTSLQGA